MGRTARGVPLLYAVTGVVVALVLTVTGAIVTEAWVSGQRNVRSIGAQLVDDVSLRTQAQVRLHLDPAVPFASLGASFVRSGDLDLQDDQAVLRFLEAALGANPSITWASFGRPDGRYLAVYRWPGETPRRTLRSAPTERTERRVADGRWELIEEVPSEYDPRVRPWYLAASTALGGTWTPPYVFLSRRQIGVAYSLALRGATGDLEGVLAAEFEAGTLSDFLASVRVSPKGQVFLIDRDGRVVGDPNGMPEDLQAVPTVQERSEGPLFAAWAALQTSDLGTYQARLVGEYLVTSRPFPAEVGIPWLVITVVPVDDYMGPINASRRRATLIALLVLLLGLVSAWVFSRRLTGAIGEVQQEMERLTTFELTERRLADRVTGIRELNEMARSADAMKEGLRSFARYVPHQLVRQLLRSGGEARLGAERREMTVLFTDIAGFTTVVESTEPDVVLHALAAYLERMNAEIHATDGTVCQYLGDAIEAFWGAPQVRSDHALRARRSALAMRQASRAMVERAREMGLPVFPTRFGVNTGEVMVGNVGAPDRFNYAIVGDPVNTAARLETLNKVYGTEVLVGEQTRLAVGDALVFRPVDWVRVKGRAQPARVFELVGEFVPSEVGAALEAYSLALDAYRDRRFDEALERLARVAAVLPEDGPTRVLLDRCLAYREHPPNGDWDGVHVMTHK